MSVTVLNFKFFLNSVVCTEYDFSLPDDMCTGNVNTKLQLWSLVKEVKGLYLFLALRGKQNTVDGGTKELFCSEFSLSWPFWKSISWFILCFINSFTSGKYVKYCEFIFPKNIAMSVTIQLVTLLATFCWTLSISLLFHLTSTRSRCIFWD